jgi:hypothetical protein
LLLIIQKWPLISHHSIRVFPHPNPTPEGAVYLPSGGLMLLLMRFSSTRIASSRFLMPNTAKGRAIYSEFTPTIFVCVMQCAVILYMNTR